MKPSVNFSHVVTVGPDRNFYSVSYYFNICGEKNQAAKAKFGFSLFSKPYCVVP